MRTAHQDAAKSTVLEKLSSSQVFIVMDWAMKFLPVSFRESQSEWFGKKGKSWHVSAAITKSAKEELEVWIPIKNNDVVISDHGIGKDNKRSVKLVFDGQSLLFLRCLMLNSLKLILNKG